MIGNQSVSEYKTNVISGKGERDALFDNIKAILIFLVVVGHIINRNVYPYTIVKAVYNFIYFFHMPAFIFISGYFSKNVDKCRDTAIKKYLIPYFIVNTLLYMQEFYYSIGNPDSTIVFRIFMGPVGSWFLFATFVWKLLLKDLAKIRFAIPFFFIFGLAAGFSHEFSLLLSLGRLASNTIFFLLGYFTTAKQIEKIRNFPKIISAFIVVGMAALCYFFASTDILPPATLLARRYYRDSQSLYDMFFRIVFYIGAILLTVAIINLTSRKKSFLTKIGRNTITVYILHLFVSSFLDELSQQNHWFEGQSISYIIYTLCISIILTYLFSRDVVVKGYNKLIDFANKLIFK